MWSNDGYFVFDRKTIVKGPDLQKIAASHQAYLGGIALPLEFWDNSPGPTLGWKQPNRLCVASIVPVSPQRANLRLVSNPTYDPYDYSVIYGYNVVKHRGNMETFRKSKDEEPLGYDPSRLPNSDEIMKLDDNGFIMVYALHMLSYKQSEKYVFPLRCRESGCQNVIRHHLDMRKLSGACLCPECFARVVQEREGNNPYLVRAAQVLPNRMLAVSIWPKPIMAEGE